MNNSKSKGIFLALILVVVAVSLAAIYALILAPRRTQLLPLESKLPKPIPTKEWAYNHNIKFNNKFYSGEDRPVVLFVDKTSKNNLLMNSPLTAEMWINLSDKSTSGWLYYLMDVPRGRTDKQMQLKCLDTIELQAASTGNSSKFKIKGDIIQTWGTDNIARRGWPLLSNNTFTVNQWHHLALVINPPNNNEITAVIYVDGIKEALVTLPAPDPACKTLVWADPGTSHIVSGLHQAAYDEFRVSTIARYQGDFLPPMTPFVTDQNTFSLYHFDNNLNDSSGNNVRLYQGDLGSGSTYKFIKSDLPFVQEVPIPTMPPQPY